MNSKLMIYVMVKMTVATFIYGGKYYQNFDNVAPGPLSNANYTGQYFKIDSFGQGKVLVSTSPGGWDKTSEANSPDLGMFDRNESGGFTLEYQLKFPDSWDANPSASQWKENNKVWAYLLAPSGSPFLSLEFRPNRRSDTHYPSLYLKNQITGKVDSAKTGVTPYGRGSKAGVVNIKLVINSVVDGDSTIQVFYGENGNYSELPILSMINADPIAINKIRFRYKTGTGSVNWHVHIDNIVVYTNSTIVHDSEFKETFDAVLYNSNGTSTTTIRTPEDYHQATFRLIDGSFQSAFSGWENYQNVIIRSMNGSGVGATPLLIGNAVFSSYENGAFEDKKFFMASFPEDTIPRTITIKTSPAYEMVSELVQTIQLIIEGNTINLTRSEDQPYTFKSKGVKEITARIGFDSGFIGTSKFKITVE